MTYPWPFKLSFSLLKSIDPQYGSPAHFLASCKAKHTPTPAMRLGTLVHWEILKGHRKPFVYGASKTLGPDARKAWAAFKAEHAGEEIYGADEAQRAAEIARDAMSLQSNLDALKGWVTGDGYEPTQYETMLEWSMCGFEMYTRGVDIIMPHSRRIADLKTCTSVQRDILYRNMMSLRYPEQLVTYEAAVRECYWDPSDSAIVALQTEFPHFMVAAVLSEAARARAVDRVYGWLSTLRNCLDRDTWPGPQGWEIEPPAWEALEGECELQAGEV